MQPNVVVVISELVVEPATVVVRLVELELVLVADVETGLVMTVLEVIVVVGEVIVVMLVGVTEDSDEAVVSRVEAVVEVVTDIVEVENAEEDVVVRERVSSWVEEIVSLMEDVVERITCVAPEDCEVVTELWEEGVPIPFEVTVTEVESEAVIPLWVNVAERVRVPPAVAPSTR